MSSVDQVAREIVDIFNQQDVLYAIMGGLAVRAHAIPRATFDVDFTAALDPKDLDDFYVALESRGCLIPEAQRSGWVDTLRGFPVVKVILPVAERYIDVDIFLADTPFQQSILARRQLMHADGWDAWFVSAEDLILLKLVADRPKDRLDIDDIFFIQGTLDEVYLQHWATELRVTQQLQRALRNRL